MFEQLGPAVGNCTNAWYYHFSDVHTYPMNPAYESATFWIQSPEWKFMNALWIRNRVDANLDIIDRVQFLTVNLQGGCRAPRYRFLTCCCCCCCRWLYLLLGYLPTIHFKFITKCDKCYYKVWQLILSQSAIAFLLQGATEHGTRNREITAWKGKFKLA